MTIAEMQAFLEREEPDEQNCAMRKSFEVCLRSAETANQLKFMIGPLKPSLDAAYLLALGHFIAMAAINQIVEEGLLDSVNPVERTVQ